MADGSLFDLPQFVRESHLDLATLFDCENTLREALQGIWLAATPLWWEITRQTNVIDHWASQVRQLPEALKGARESVAPVLHELPTTDKIRLPGAVRPTACEALVASAEFTLKITDTALLADAATCDTIARLLHTMMENTSEDVTAWGNVAPLIRDEITAAASNRESKPRKDLLPRTYLQSWLEILDALKLKNNETNKGRIQRANEKFDGPIVIPRGRGSQPFVERAKLIDWHNGLEDRYKELAQREIDKKATVAKQHEYGRDGTVVPDIQGSVKKKKSEK